MEITKLQDERQPLVFHPNDLPQGDEAGESDFPSPVVNGIVPIPLPRLSIYRDLFPPPEEESIWKLIRPSGSVPLKAG